MAGRAGNRTSRRAPLNLRTTEDMRAKLEAAADAAGRNLTQEVEYRIEQSFLWEESFGDRREWLAKHKAEEAEIEKGNTKAALARQGWHKIAGTQYGTVWVEPGAMSEKSGFIDPSEAEAKPPVIDEPLIAMIRFEVQKTVAEALATTGKGSKPGSPSDDEAAASSRDEEAAWNRGYQAGYAYAMEHGYTEPPESNEPPKKAPRGRVVQGRASYKVIAPEKE